MHELTLHLCISVLSLYGLLTFQHETFSGLQMSFAERHFALLFHGRIIVGHILNIAIVQAEKGSF